MKYHPAPTPVPPTFLNNEDYELRLPSTFAEELLGLELQVDTQDYNTVVMHRLNELYRMGVEYYVLHEPQKAVFFQKRLANLLSSPQTLRLIDPRSKISRQSLMQENIKQEVSKFNSQASICIQSIMETTEKRLHQGEDLIRQSLTGQEDRLKTRMLQRIKSKKLI